MIASETPAPAPAPAAPPAHERAPERARVDRSISDTARLDALWPFWPLPFANASTDRPSPPLVDAAVADVRSRIMDAATPRGRSGLLPDASTGGRGGRKRSFLESGRNFPVKNNIK